jgi:glycosyltransferase involved in cell wall biosynthesis
MATKMGEFELEVSAVVPVGARRDDVPALLDEYAAGIASGAPSFEIIVVLDGPSSQLMPKLRSMTATRRWLKVVELGRHFGESAALTTGFQMARGRLVLTLPAYYQIEPSELPKIIEAGDTADMAIAVRWPRTGSTFEGLRRSAFHGLLKLFTNQRYRDLGCSVRLMSRTVVDEIPLYSEQHRFFPTLAHSRGFEVREIEASQSPKDRFIGQYRVREYLHRLLDIMTLFFLLRFTKKPLRFFGMIGCLLAFLGVMVLALVIVQRLFFEVALADRPALLLGALSLVLGVQIFALGLIGELIIFTHARNLKEYVVRRVIGRGETGERELTVLQSQEPADSSQERRQA